MGKNEYEGERGDGKSSRKRTMTKDKELYIEKNEFKSKYIYIYTTMNKIKL